MQHPYFYARYLERLEREGVLLRQLTPSDAARVGDVRRLGHEAAVWSPSWGRRVTMNAGHSAVR